MDIFRITVRQKMFSPMPPSRTQPTPGNITLHPTLEGVQVIWYDIRFMPYVLATMSYSPADTNLVEKVNPTAAP